MLIIGFILYCSNYTIGILAKNRKFKNILVHRILFASNLIMVCLITIFQFNYFFILTIISIALLRLTKPWKKLHPTDASIGLLGYILSVINIYIYRII